MKNHNETLAWIAGVSVGVILGITLTYNVLKQSQAFDAPYVDAVSVNLCHDTVMLGINETATFTLPDKSVVIAIRLRKALNEVCTARQTEEEAKGWLKNSSE